MLDCTCADRPEPVQTGIFSEEREMARKFFDHQQFNFEFQFALGGVHYGAGDLGEMLSTADRIVDGDADSWCQEWIATGQRVAALAGECEQSAYQVSAPRGVPKSGHLLCGGVVGRRWHEGP